MNEPRVPSGVSHSRIKFELKVRSKIKTRSKKLKDLPSETRVSNEMKTFMSACKPMGKQQMYR